MGRRKQQTRQVGNSVVKTIKRTEVMLSSGFLKGWKSYRRGLPFENETREWHYERGRQFAALYPEFTQIREGNKVYMPAYLALSEAMSAREIL